MHATRLLHAIVVVGCAMASLPGCSGTEANPCVSAMPDGGGEADGGVDASPDAALGDASLPPHGMCAREGEGWPPTK